MIPNKISKQIVSVLKSRNTVPVGSFGRDSKLENYKDLDFLTTNSLSDMLNYAKRKWDIKIIKNGKQYISFKIDDKYQVDIWHTTKENFLKDYIKRYLPKHKVINLYRKHIL